MRAWTLLPALLAAGMLLAGCADTETGEATPAATGSAPTNSSPSGGDTTPEGAPKVENPLDTSKYQQDPCSTLTSAQLQELALDEPGEEDPAKAGPACFWWNNEAVSNASIIFVTAGNNGISDIYANQDTNAVFEELPAIEGHPVVAYGSVAGEHEKGYCTLAVGATDQLFLSIGVKVSRANVGQRDPCVAAQGVAEMMINTMQGGS
ncbi:uncharacterized protein DUF3558 [Tamaricihabitans halophyticus]|uniref:Uncharacterized protein DUF3558 n=1 Tax=Tamaricihabitans halophyticus TaxID=1262583 RepID=A0A4R2QVA9_9PSEU|nr:DUF3558 domain-containing protein [Tamaricihabitans halophyticus]TCP53667.1 uncharacterized protein DUF3558 [Tamaricihabitans halophyticus]